MVNIYCKLINMVEFVNFIVCDYIDIYVCVYLGLFWM